MRRALRADQGIDPATAAAAFCDQVLRRGKELRTRRWIVAHMTWNEPRCQCCHVLGANQVGQNVAIGQHREHALVVHQNQRADIVSILPASNHGLQHGGLDQSEFTAVQLQQTVIDWMPGRTLRRHDGAVPNLQCLRRYVPHGHAILGEHAQRAMNLGTALLMMHQCDGAARRVTCHPLRPEGSCPERRGHYGGSGFTVSSRHCRLQQRTDHPAIERISGTDFANSWVALGIKYEVWPVATNLIRHAVGDAQNVTHRRVEIVDRPNPRIVWVVLNDGTQRTVQRPAAFSHRGHLVGRQHHGGVCHGGQGAGPPVGECLGQIDTNAIGVTKRH
ncbi:hypothetical protein C7S18_00340 [Ahniella affigens]|uniref:Uncharacterized protein n=1 Tax=Ahniella affigens TaxID=2021234 RepID=A0A2P1PLM2_9GAMM|nr:hypothetical protein C7S18_00340 [Ahniella affigens]